MPAIQREPNRPSGFDQNGRLGAVAVGGVGDSADVYEGVHGAVGHLRRPLVVGLVVGSAGGWARAEIMDLTRRRLLR